MTVYIPVYNRGWSVLRADTEKTIAGKRQFKRWGTTDRIVYCGTIYNSAYRTEAEAWNYIHGEWATPLTWDEMLPEE